MMTLLVYVENYHVDNENMKPPPYQTPDIDFDDVSNDDVDSLF